MNLKRRILLCMLSTLIILVINAPIVHAGEATTDIVDRVLGGEPENVGVSLRLLLVTTVVAIAPALLLLTTSFTRIIVVLGFVRRAIGTQDAPPNTVLVGLSLLLTMAVMGPTWNDIYTNAIQPYSEQVPSPVTGDVPDGQQTMAYAEQRMREFMYPAIYESDLLLLAQIGAPQEFATLYDGNGIITKNFVDALPATVVVPAFVLSELKRAFEMGVMIFIPFLIIDLVVSAILVSMGMFMLPPILVSLPFKILVFVLVDGWSLVVQQLLISSGSAVAG